ncbi:EF-hand domain-containing protein [Streptomyces vilmorinianum]|uniref:EF-hand domain-containing protein n=1 Tax=Streptomyces vilmorinianum TaxID=3051092 RepID=UPI0024E148F4|nr:EF-hand domain-containing protein [Streptomyces vilmorinianum]
MEPMETQQDPGQLYRRRIASRFAAFDQDGDGTISREDFTTAATRLLTEFGTPFRSERGQALCNGAEAFWQGMAGIADVDGDQRVSHAEFVGGAVKRLHDHPERFAEIARPFLRAALALATTPADVERGLLALGVSPLAAALSARTLPTVASGAVDEEAAVAAFARYFMTE